MQTSQKEIAAAFDLAALPPGFHEDPYPVYEALRTHAPQKRLPNGSILLTRYDDCLQAYRDPAFSADKTREFRPKFGHSPLYDHHTTSLVFNDPPLHTRVRRLMPAPSPRAPSPPWNRASSPPSIASSTP